MINIIVAPGIGEFNLQNNKFTIEHKNITLNELLKDLIIDKNQVGAILINGIPKKFTQKVEDNCEIYILPILGGG